MKQKHTKYTRIHTNKSNIVLRTVCYERRHYLNCKQMASKYYSDSDKVSVTYVYLLYLLPGVAIFKLPNAEASRKPSTQPHINRKVIKIS